MCSGKTGGDAMFTDFLYLLRRSGLKVSLTEWMTLMEALHHNLHDASFTGFYHLCRCILVKSEADFDQFDRCFLEYFKDVDFQQEVSQDLLNWLNKPDVLQKYANWDEQQAELNEQLSNLEIEEMFRERMNEQREEHNCGNHWVGTHGMSVFGNAGLSPKGIRVGGRAQVPGFPPGQYPGHPAVSGGPASSAPVLRSGGPARDGVRRGPHHPGHRRQRGRAEGAL